MALCRKRMKNNRGEYVTRPVRCSFCKEKKALKSAHGGYVDGGGRSCCDECYSDLQKQEERLQERECHYEPSEADYQTWMRL